MALWQKYYHTPSSRWGYWNRSEESNRTGGSPASGSRTRLHAFTHGRRAQARLYSRRLRLDQPLDAGSRITEKRLTGEIHARRHWSTPIQIPATDGARSRRRNIAMASAWIDLRLRGELVNGSATIAAHHDAYKSTRFTRPNMTYSLAAAAAALDPNKTPHPAHRKDRDSSHAERMTISVHPRPMSSAPLDGTPVVYSPLSGLRSPPFGAWNARGKRSGPGTIVRAGFCSRMTRSSLMNRWDGNR